MLRYKCWLHGVLVAAMMLVAYRQNAAAQPTRSIAGSYRMEATRSPEGGTHLMLLPDSMYVVVFFGGARAGRWRVVNDSLLQLTPTDRPAHPFALYGRHHVGLAGKSRIFYTGAFSNGGRYVRVGGTPAGRAQSVRRVFNEDANCFPFPNVDTFAGVPDSISFMLQTVGEDDGRGDAYTFGNPERYNDFVAVATDREASDVLRGDAPMAVVRRDGLYIVGSRYFAEREELPASAEDQAFFRFLTARNPDPDTVLYNPKYREVSELADGDEEPFDLKNYRVVQSGDALVTANYKEGAEYGADYDFHDMQMLYVFRAVRPVVARGVRVRMEGKPVFRVVCE